MISHELPVPQILCLFGAGGHGRVVAAQLVRRFGTQIVFGDSVRPLGSRVDDHEVRFSEVTGCGPDPVLVCIGDNETRRGLMLRAAKAGVCFGTVVIDHDTFFAAPAGEGAQVLAGAVVNCGATVGRGVIVNTNAVVEHDAVIGDFCHIAPGTVVGGGASLGEGVFLGTGAVVLPGINVAPWSVIGAGAVVTRSITDAGTYIGVPARFISGTRVGKSS